VRDRDARWRQNANNSPGKVRLDDALVGRRRQRGSVPALPDTTQGSRVGRVPIFVHCLGEYL
jgi:hypothetical protein